MIGHSRVHDVQNVDYVTSKNVDYEITKVVLALQRNIVFVLSHCVIRITLFVTLFKLFICILLSFVANFSGFARTGLAVWGCQLLLNP